MIKPILISGIQPSGALHVGNYLGALKNFVELQNSGKYRCFFFVADLHSLTEDFNPKEKPTQIAELVHTYLAAGIDPKKSTVFVQSAIPAHTELMWILNTITPMGELMRMTQFKEKVENIREFRGEIKKIRDSIEDTFKQVGGLEILGEKNKKHLVEHLLQEELKEKIFTVPANAGLFDYPVLMAADILLYDAKFVPVGDDQDQHLELARTLARKFNAKFGKTFTEPQSLHTKIPRLTSLDNPQKKMSKSRPLGCLFIDDSPNTIREKLKRAVTDSGREIKYDPARKPAISNLLLVYSAMGNVSVPTIEKKYRGKGYAEFKKDLAEVIVKALTPFQAKKKELKAQDKKLKAILTAGNKKANAVAGKKLLEVKKRIGLIA
ncbi:MAG: tryptophan--tRNA ligase [Candidatus Jorgensenbacteria bacterium]